MYLNKYLIYLNTVCISPFYYYNLYTIAILYILLKIEIIKSLKNVTIGCTLLDSFYEEQIFDMKIVMTYLTNNNIQYLNREQRKKGAYL